MTNPDMRSMVDHHPQRGDQVEAWLQDRLEQFEVPGQVAESIEGWRVLHNVLEEYRLAADNMQSLEVVVNGEVEEPKTARKKKKAPAKKTTTKKTATRKAK